MSFFVSVPVLSLKMYRTCPKFSLKQLLLQYAWRDARVFASAPDFSSTYATGVLFAVSEADTLCNDRMLRRIIRRSFGGVSLGVRACTHDAQVLVAVDEE